MAILSFRHVVCKCIWKVHTVRKLIDLNTRFNQKMHNILNLSYIIYLFKKGKCNKLVMELVLHNGTHAVTYM